VSLDEQRARMAYRITHWGAGGSHPGVRVLPAANPADPLVELGELFSLVYRTHKLGDGPSEYEHEFSAPLPLLAFSVESRRLVIAGGHYRVTARGIVG
jgi:hypothetical protein